MKTILVILLFSTASLTVYAQFRQPDSKATESPNNSNQVVPNTAYRLFKTENMWTFIKLNTRTGQMWQVQFDINGDNRHELSLYSESLVNPENEFNERFTLHATQNMYNFILLDQYDGRTWQAQWSPKAENRGIIPIY